MLLVPGIEAAGLHTDGNVEIQTNRQTTIPSDLRAALQLLVRAPLHKLDELDFLCILAAAKLRQCGVVRAFPRIWPIPPRSGVFAPQDFKTGKPRQRRSSRGAQL